MCSLTQWQFLEYQQFLNNQNPNGRCNIIGIQIENETQIIKNYHETSRVIELIEYLKQICPNTGYIDKKNIEHRNINNEEEPPELQKMSDNEMSDNEINDNEMNDNEMNDNEIIDLNDTSKKIIKKKEVKPRKKSISATMKRIVWNTYIGQKFGEAKCLCCKITNITQMSFHCGHVVAESCGGELIVTNLRPICQNCNSSMRTKNMNDFMESFNK